MNTQITIFDGSDTQYQSWLREHYDGFVLNRRRGKSDSYLVLHRASCLMIRTYNNMAKPGAFTERLYIKVCSTKTEPLKEYARSIGRSTNGSFSSKCSRCNP
jgi:hypothetical protein